MAPAGLCRAKEAMGTDNIVTISRRYSSRTFGFASRNYYIAFLAALQVDRDPEKVFRQYRARMWKPRHARRSLPGLFSGQRLGKHVLGEGDLLRSLNPALTSAVWKGERHIPRGFELRLPEQTIAELSDPMQLLASSGPVSASNRRKPSASIG